MTPTEPNPQSAPVRRFRDPLYKPLAENLGEIRANIDGLDRAIVQLLAERAAYVKDATRFKLDPHQVAAPARQAEVFAKVRRLADEFGAPPEVIEAGYRALVAGFVANEHLHFSMTDSIPPAPERKP